MDDTPFNACLWSGFDRHPDGNIAIVTPEGAWSYGMLRRAVMARARELKSLSDQALAGLVFSDQLELGLTALALMRLGLPWICLPRSLPLPQAREWLERAGATCCLTDDPVHLSSGHMHGIPVQYLAKVNRPSTTPSEAVLSAQEDCLPMPDLNRLCMVIGGSATTGDSKLIPVTHGQMLHRIRSTMASLGLTHRDKSLGLVHMEYASGMHRFLAVLYSGGSVWLLNTPPANPLQWVADHSITVISATVAHALWLLSLCPEGTEGPAWPKLRLMTLAGSVVDERLRQRVRQHLTPRLSIVYGTNECWYATVALPDAAPWLPHSVGWPAHGSQVRVVNREGESLPAMQTGYIEVQSASLMGGYWQEPSAQTMLEYEREATEHSWFRTGDLGHLASDGQLVFDGRADNMIICNGVNVSPLEIEQALLSFPDILEAVAFGVEHQGQHFMPACAIVPRQADLLETRALMRHLQGLLGFRVPRQILVLNQLPRTAHGKVSVLALVACLQEKSSASPSCSD